MAQRRTHQPNQQLAQLIEVAGCSRAALALRVNRLAASAGLSRSYTHTSIQNWTERGMRPDKEVLPLLAAALGERLGRPVSLEEMGFGASPAPAPVEGLNFPKGPHEALHLSAEYWSTVDRRQFTAAAPFALAAYGAPVTRWLTKPADPPLARSDGARRVGTADLAELHQAADEARRWDSKYGGGNWRASMVTDCLAQRAAPLLQGQFTEAIGSQLFAATAELARIAAWADVDMGRHASAQQHFVQALRLARASGDPAIGSYVLATMSLHTFLCGYTTEAADMAEGAFERAGRAPARVLAFAKLAEARAHGRAGNTRDAEAALARCEQLVEAADQDPDDPDWLAYLTHARVAADAAEIYRDLGQPECTLAWERQATAMPADAFTRAVGIRHTIIATAHLQQHDLEPGLAAGEQALTILTNLHSTRSLAYLRALTDALAPVRSKPQVADFLHRADRVLTTP
ncbi:sporulation protein [Kitasatospora sp. NPDC057198]|uniref:sporulation protein n=1 Tax=Kitasatospora sp. NPDC057198 TaxID=3346046 RepID=UPI00362ECB49